MWCPSGFTCWPSIFFLLFASWNIFMLIICSFIWMLISKSMKAKAILLVKCKGKLGLLDKTKVLSLFCLSLVHVLSKNEWESHRSPKKTFKRLQEHQITFVQHLQEYREVKSDGLKLNKCILKENKRKSLLYKKLHHRSLNWVLCPFT